MSAVCDAAAHDHIFPKTDHHSLQRCIEYDSETPPTHLCQPGHDNTTGDKTRALQPAEMKEKMWLGNRKETDERKTVGDSMTT